jgi:hypothetical protein
MLGMPRIAWATLVLGSPPDCLRAIVPLRDARTREPNKAVEHG